MKLEDDEKEFVFTRCLDCKYRQRDSFFGCWECTMARWRKWGGPPKFCSYYKTNGKKYEI